MSALPAAVSAQAPRRRADSYRALRRLLADPDHRMIVAFGGGSLPGLAGNVALAAILDELDLRDRVEQVWGTSAGAIVGAAFAAGRSPGQMLALIRAAGARPRAGLGPAVLRTLLALLLRRPLPDGIIATDAFARAIEHGIGVRDFAQCAIPFRCIACTDDGIGTPHVFRRGSILPAVIASMSLPGIFRPPAWLPESHRRFHDGGMVEKTPLRSPIAEHERSGDPRRLVILATHFGPRRRGGQPRGFVDRFLQSIDVLEDRLWQHQLAEVRARRDVRLLLLEPPTDGAMLDFGRVPANFLRARDALRAALRDEALAVGLAAD